MERSEAEKRIDKNMDELAKEVREGR